MCSSPRKKILLAGINSKFIHVNLAVRSIAAYCRERGADVDFIEFTVNESIDRVISCLIAEKPDVLGFSCYIWNIEPIIRIIGAVRKVLPEVVIVAGGPEVSFEEDDRLYEARLGVDYIIQGEGEQAFFELINGLDCNKQALAHIKMKELPFPYSNFDDIRDRIVNYETSRGCPNRCGFCLSSASEGVRFKDTAKVFPELDVFIAAKIKQVKLTDRTFNCDSGRAYAIWEYLIKNDNGCTNFHFEIAADMLDDAALELLKTPRPGLFQFEIGLQSANRAVLDAVNRRTDTRKLRDNITALKSYGNIHIHLDLIAGLPFEDFASFRESFDFAYGMAPDRLQLGFLKLLRGTDLRKNAAKYGIVYNDFPPYEFLYTSALPYEHTVILKAIESVLEIFYNSKKFNHTLSFVMKGRPSPFDFYRELADYWTRKGYDALSHSLRALFSILREFLAPRYGEAPGHRADHLLHAERGEAGQRRAARR